MKILLFVLGLLALASGGLKFRARIMNRIGTSPFAMGEIGLGLLSCAVAAFVADGIVLQSVVAGATLIAIFVGSYHQSKLTSAFQHRRELSESHRLRQFVGTEIPPTPKAAPGGEDHEA